MSLSCDLRGVRHCLTMGLGQERTCWRDNLYGQTLDKSARPEHKKLMYMHVAVTGGESEPRGAPVTS